MANIDQLKTWLASIKRSFQGIFVAIETMGIVKELMEIWLNEVCDITPSLGSSSIEKLLVYSEDIPAAFCLHFVNFLQVPMCCLLEYILSIWQGTYFFHVFVVSLEFFLSPILPGFVSRSVVEEWLSGHGWWIQSTCKTLATIT